MKEDKGAAVVLALFVWGLAGALFGSLFAGLYQVLEVVRGRKPAHQRERQLIAEFEPTLNTF